jgi:ribosomal protein L18
VLEMFDKKERSERSADRVRLNVSGTHDRPRVSVRFSNKHVYA